LKFFWPNALRHPAQPNPEFSAFANDPGMFGGHRRWQCISDSAAANKCMIKEMTYLADHLSGLRQEIADLQKLNTHYANKREHSQFEESALELRTVRLLQIKKELSNMLVRPNDPKVWWERLPKSRIA
jgi:hypothetical protein